MQSIAKSQEDVKPFLLQIQKIFVTRLLGRFAPIFYLNCEHVLFVYILKQRNFFCGFKKNRGFSGI